MEFEVLNYCIVPVEQARQLLPPNVVIVFSSCEFPEIFKAGPLIPPSVGALNCRQFSMISFGRLQDT